MSQLITTLSKHFIFHDDQLLLLKQGDQLVLPESENQTPWAIGEYNHFPCFAAEIDEIVDTDPAQHWVSIRAAFDHLGNDWLAAISRAYQIMRWDKNHRFCGRCGQATQVHQSRFERHCSICNLFHYPRISPSIIVLVSKGHQILLARKASFQPGIYGLIAGFVEPGETLEETVHREVKEEVGITVNNIRYFGSQPWPFPDSLMLAFEADYESGNIELVDGELDEANWYDFDDIPGFPSSSMSIARHLIDEFIHHHKNNSDNNL